MRCLVIISVALFNVTFAEAVRQTAVIAYDIKFSGAPVVYSWPVPSYYPEAESNVDVTTPRFQWLLADPVRRTHVTKIHVIAHSMGNRIVSRAIAQTQATTPAIHLQQIVLTAPDIDREELAQISDRIRVAGTRVTLYASGRDEAILLSRAYHQYPRAGDTWNGPFLAPGFDTVDATAVDTELGWGPLRSRLSHASKNGAN